MPRLFKVWNASRTVKKAVVADDIASLIEKGRAKLGITNPAECRIFDEADGTEIDDDECLALCDNSRIYIVGAEWTPATISPVFSPTVTPPPADVASPVAMPVTACCSESSVEESMTYEHSDWTDTELDVGLEIMTSTPNPKEHDLTVCNDDTPDERVDQSTDSETSQTLGKRSLLEELSGFEIKKRKIDDEKPTTSNAWSKIMNEEFRRAKQMGMKIYTPKQIKEAKSEMEKVRRQFSNNKAEQLCTRAETANIGKTAMYGIIDVAWTLKKTVLLQDEARSFGQNEKELFSDQKNETWERSTGKQKSKTIENNIVRMEIAHQSVITKDKELENIKQRYKCCTSEEQKISVEKEKNCVKTEFDGAYTELKRSQEALTKALKHKKELLDKRVREKNAE